MIQRRTRAKQQELRNRKHQTENKGVEQEQSGRHVTIAALQQHAKLFERLHSSATKRCIAGEVLALEYRHTRTHAHAHTRTHARTHAPTHPHTHACTPRTPRTHAPTHAQLR